MNVDEYESLPSQSFVVHMTAGAIAGIMEHCVMYPLDSVKTRMQSVRAVRHRGITATLRHMIAREGLLRPVRGMGAVVLGAGPAHACFFATYEHSKHSLSQLARHRHEPIVHGISGCLASLVHDAVSNPAEVVKQRLQMANSPYRGVWECARSVYSREGLRAFYRSYYTQLAINLPFQALHFTTYEWSARYMNPLRRYDPASHAACGALAGGVAAAATAPLDVCKTLLNTQAARAESLRAAWSIVLRAGGARGLFRGTSARVLYHLPAAAICWLTYESLKHLMRTMEVQPEGGPAPAAPPAPAPAPAPALPPLQLLRGVAPAPTTLTRS